jgi:UDP-galactopyranose mutase
LIKSHVERAQKYLDALPGNVLSVGRQGTYRYIDVDDIIMGGLEFQKQL